MGLFGRKPRQQRETPHMDALMAALASVFTPDQVQKLKRFVAQVPDEGVEHYMPRVKAMVDAYFDQIDARREGRPGGTDGHGKDPTRGVQLAATKGAPRGDRPQEGAQL